MSAKTVGKLEDVRSLSRRVKTATVGDMTLLRRSPKEGFVLRSTIAEGVYVPRNSVIVDSVISEQVTIGENSVVDDCKLSKCTVPSNSLVRGYDMVGTDPTVRVQPSRFLS